MAKSLLTICLLLGSSASSQDIRFFKEDITFTPGSRYFVVDGFYWFLNPSNVEREKVIFYPLDEQAGRVDSVGVEKIGGENRVKIIDRSKVGFGFVLRLKSEDTAVCHIYYRQRITADSAMYILISMRSWGRPLESVEYKLVPDGSIGLTRFSYRPDTLYTIEGRKIYYWRRADFMPDRDLVFHFRRN